jgi:hypothetical protein
MSGSKQTPCGAVKATPRARSCRTGDFLSTAIALAFHAGEVPHNVIHYGMTAEAGSR